jgi:hypothetical protein
MTLAGRKLPQRPIFRGNAEKPTNPKALAVRVQQTKRQDSSKRVNIEVSHGQALEGRRWKRYLL